MCSQNMQCIHRNSPTQSLGVDFSPTASREAVCAVGAFGTRTRAGREGTCGRWWVRRRPLSIHYRSNMIISIMSISGETFEPIRHNTNMCLQSLQHISRNILGH